MNPDIFPRRRQALPTSATIALVGQPVWEVVPMHCVKRYSLEPRTATISGHILRENDAAILAQLWDDFAW